MDFAPTPHQREAAERIVAECRCWPAGRSPYFTREEWIRCAEAGLLGLCVPEKYGGRGLGFVDTAIATEAFGTGCADLSLVFAALAHLFACAMPIAEHGTDELRERVLRKLGSGEWIGANAITEDGAGSDVAALATRAERVNGGYLLTGRKSFVSNGPVADVFLVYAVTDPRLGHLGVSGFAVERNSPGLVASEPFAKSVLRRCPAGTVDFDRCFVPLDHLLGRDGQGGMIFQASMRWERTCLLAAYLGQTERLLDRCVAHARSRRQFGRPIGANQAVSHRLARMRVRAQAARLLLWHACWLMDRGEPAELAVAMAKLALSESATDAALDALRVFGGAGVQDSTGLGTELADALPSTVFSGTTEMQLEQIATGLGL